MRYGFVDNLRVFAFALLILYHSSCAFLPGLDWLLASPDTSPVLDAVMLQPRGWRLALLFFVSGMGTWFAFRSRGLGQFLRERLERLLVPLLFAMAVLVVPQVWIERMWSEGYDGSLLTFWLTRYFTEGKYPDGQLTWAHMWFVGYLISMTFVAVPVFLALESPAAARFNAWFRRLVGTPWILALFLFPLALNLAFSPWFPRQTNALYNDGAWFATWAAWFGLGYLIARDGQVAFATIMRLRFVTAALAVLLTIALYRLAFFGGDASIGDYAHMTPAFKMVLMPFAWAMILALTGLFARHANGSSAFVTWARQGVFPFYIIHQTVIVGALYLILPLDLGLWTKYALVVATTIAGSALFYEIGRALPGPLRILVGLPGAPARKPAGVPVAAQPA